MIIGLFLGALQAFFIGPGAHCIGRISESNANNYSNWEKNSTKLKGSSSGRLKGSLRTLAKTLC